MAFRNTIALLFFANIICATADLFTKEPAVVDLTPENFKVSYFTSVLLSAIYLNGRAYTCKNIYEKYSCRDTCNNNAQEVKDDTRLWLLNFYTPW